MSSPMILKMMNFTLYFQYIAIALCIMLVAFRKFKPRNQRLPPGPWKLPLIGSLHHLLGFSLPQYGLRELSKKYGPIMHLQLGEIPAVVISSREAAKEIMKINDLAFVQRPKLLSPALVLYDCADIAFAPYGDYWREMRKFCIQHMLSVKQVKAFSSIRDDEIASTILSVKSMLGKPIDIVDLISSMVSAITTRASLGNSKSHDAYSALAKESINLVSSFNAIDAFPSMKFLHVMDPKKAKLMKLYEKLDKILNSIIEDRKNDTIQKNSTKYLGTNLVDALLELQHSNSLKIPLTTNNIKAVIWDILAAGIDTPSRLLFWAMLELMANPKVMQKLQLELRKTLKGNTKINEDDIDKVGYLRLVTKEVLRLHPPAAILPLRECKEACEIGGYKIPVKTNIIINAWSIGRDPKYWHDADAFLPERFIDNNVDFRGQDFEYIPFGAGRRICPGMSFGLAMIEYPLAQLLYHFNWELPEGVKAKDLDMNLACGENKGGNNNLYLVATAYTPS